MIFIEVDSQPAGSEQYVDFSKAVLYGPLCALFRCDLSEERCDVERLTELFVCDCKAPC